MFKFAFGLVSGIVLGVFGTFVSAIVAIVTLEESPELLDALRDRASE